MLQPVDEDVFIRWKSALSGTRYRSVTAALPAAFDTMADPTTNFSSRQVKLPRHRLRMYATTLYDHYNFQGNTSPPEHPLKVVCISDTHNTKPNIPDGDLLLHGSDLTEGGTFDELQDQLHWLNAQPHRYKVTVAGNHDLLLGRSFPGKQYRSIR